MTQDGTLGRISPRLVEGLLLSRPTYDEEECRFSDLIASMVQGVATDEEKEAARIHLLSCVECNDAIGMLREIESGLPNHAVDARSLWEKRPSKRSQRIAAFAAAAVMLFVSGIVLFYRGTDASRSGSDTLRVKGDGDTVFVAVKRGTVDFTAQPLDRLKNGDRVGFFYSAEKDGFAAVFNVDSAGSVTRLFPSESGKSAPIRAAERSPLPDGALVEEGRGCEWVAAVFSDTPLDLNTVEGILSQSVGTRLDDSCDYDPDVPDARSVIVVPFRR